MMATDFGTFTAGNVFTAASGIATMAALWWRTAQREQRSNDKIAALELRQNTTEQDMREMAKIGLLTTVAQHERRIMECEKVISDIREMQNDIQWIKRDLEQRNK